MWLTEANNIISEKISKYVNLFKLYFMSLVDNKAWLARRNKKELTIKWKKVKVKEHGWKTKENLGQWIHTWREFWRFEMI